MTERERWQLIRQGKLRYLTSDERRILAELVTEQGRSVGPLRPEPTLNNPYVPAMVWASERRCGEW